MSSTPYDGLFAASGAKWGVDPSLLREVARQESGFNPNAGSGAGAVGLMQFMPGTAAGLGVNPRDPASSIDGAARMFKRLLSKYNGDVGKSLAAYNAGEGAVDRYGGVPPYAETQNYVRVITGRLGSSGGGSSWLDKAKAAAQFINGNAVPGAAQAGQATTDAASSLADNVLGSLVGALRPIAVTGVLLIGGAGLVVAGLWRSVSSAKKPATA